MTDFPEFFDRHFEIKTHPERGIQAESCRLRYQVYYLERGYEIADQCVGEEERDQFDLNSLHSVIRHRGSGRSMATVRLVRGKPSTVGHRFPLDYSFPDLLTRHGIDERLLPRESSAEISRFAISKASRRDLPHLTSGLGRQIQLTQSGGRFNGRMYPLVTFGLFVALMRLSARNDITHWLALMEPSLLRLLSRFGIVFNTIGGLVDYHGRRQPCYGRVDEIRDNVRSVEANLFALAQRHTEQPAPRFAWH